MRLTIDERWRVHASSDIDLPLPVSVVWGQMRDLPRFLSLDPLHARVRIAGARVPGQGWVGVPLVIEHRLFGIGPDRRGRVLSWREGVGYAVSDLSKRGNRVGFPHVCVYELFERGRGTCLLRVSARGVWTARWTPRVLVKLWLWWVLFATEARVRGEVVRYARWLRCRCG